MSGVTLLTAGAQFSWPLSSMPKGSQKDFSSNSYTFHFICVRKKIEPVLQAQIVHRYEKRT